MLKCIRNKSVSIPSNLVLSLRNYWVKFLCSKMVKKNTKKNQKTPLAASQTQDTVAASSFREKLFEGDAINLFIFDYKHTNENTLSGMRLLIYW